MRVLSLDSKNESQGLRSCIWSFRILKRLNVQGGRFFPDNSKLTFNAAHEARHLGERIAGICRVEPTGDEEQESGNLEHFAKHPVRLWKRIRIGELEDVHLRFIVVAPTRC